MRLQNIILSLIGFFLTSSSVLANTKLLTTLERINNESSFDDRKKEDEISKLYNYYIGEWGSALNNIKTAPEDKKYSKITKKLLGNRFALTCTILSEKGGYYKRLYPNILHITPEYTSDLIPEANISQLPSEDNIENKYKFDVSTGRGILEQKYQQSFELKDGFLVSTSPYITSGYGSNSNSVDNRRIKFLKDTHNNLISLITENSGVFGDLESSIMYCSLSWYR